MVSFQQDFLLTLNKYHEQYNTKMDILFNNEQLIKDVTMEDAEKLVEYTKEYKCLINSMCLLVDKINNIKNINEINNKIENELILKMMPIMNIYRTLLYEKYSDKMFPIGTIGPIESTINEQI